ncbi:MAG TPA: DoxX family protein [Cytophaga sp.]|jgi:putative oxidoreductase|nr:DoxX family protein [Cytophaga sp.]
MDRIKTILIWIIGIMFILTGISKLLYLDAMSAEMFDRAQFPSILFYSAGACELIGGILLIMPKTRQLGAVVISAVMVGAVVTHIYLRDSAGHIIVPALIILFAGWMFIKTKK